jgi:hypothetical protein
MPLGAAVKQASRLGGNAGLGHHLSPFSPFLSVKVARWCQV